MYNSNLKSDTVLIDYLKNKLGPENSMVIVEVDDNATLNDISNSNKLSKNQKIFYVFSHCCFFTFFLNKFGFFRILRPNFCKILHFLFSFFEKISNFFFF